MLQKYLEKINRKKQIFKSLIQGYIQFTEDEKSHLTIYVNEKNPLHQAILELIDELPFEVSVEYV